MRVRTAGMSVWTSGIICFLGLLLAGCAGSPVGAESGRAEWQRQADWYYARADWEAAERPCLELARIEPVGAQDWFRLGNVYANTDRLRAAAEAYTEALKRAPERGDIRFNQALTLLRLAVNEWNQALTLGDDATAMRGQIVGLLEALLDQFMTVDSGSAEDVEPGEPTRTD